VSHFPVEALSYETVASEYFLGLVGAGLMLSPLDLELVHSYERRGIPVEIVCRGLRLGFEAAVAKRPPGSPPPRTMRAYRFAVENEWRAYREGRVGSAPPPEDDERSVGQTRVEAARLALRTRAQRAAVALRSGYAEAESAISLAPKDVVYDLGKVDELFTRVDELLMVAWRRGLDRTQRTALGAALKSSVGPRQPGCTRRAHRDALRGQMALLAKRSGLYLLRGSV